ncbi:MAG: cyclic nucleotide-binding domain-containing protein, partial [Sandaracinaceae bacterium]|nr:cyclic nucleotide-binding domain-containing protein [Sandaracinaceae bacterium]
CAPRDERRARDGEEPMRTTLEKVLLLKGASLFARVSSEDLMPLAVAADERTYAKGETIVREGEVGDALFVILHGRVSVLRGGSRLATLGPGETVGEMAVLDAEPRSATVRADEETAVLVIASEDFYEVLREQVEIAEGVIRTLTRRLREANTAFDPMSIAPPRPDPD